MNAEFVKQLSPRELRELGRLVHLEDTERLVHFYNGAQEARDEARNAARDGKQKSCFSDGHIDHQFTLFVDELSDLSDAHAHGEEVLLREHRILPRFHEQLQAARDKGERQMT